MATKKPPSGRISDIVSYRRSQGGSVTGSLAGGIKDRLKEKFDPRQLINQKGLMTALFPGLKTYQAKTAASELSSSSMRSTSFDEIKPILETISYSTKMTAKNTMVLPALHRDVNVIRQNMVKLVKLKGGDARTKADMYFVKSKDREDKYERELKKERIKQRKVEKVDEEEKEKTKGFLGGVFSIIIKTLEGIVSSIVKLGKVILKSFKFLAEVIVEVISTALSFIMKPLKLLGGVLKDFIGNFFKNRLMYILVSSFVRAAVSSVFGLLFSKKTLARLGWFLLGVFGSTFGLQWAAEAYRKNSMIGPQLNPADELDEKKETGKKAFDRYKDLLETSEKKSTLPYQITNEEFEDLKKSGVLPQNANREATVGREAGYLGKEMKVDDGMFTDIVPTGEDVGGIQSAMFNKQSYDDFYKSKSKKLYKVPIPTLKDPLTLLLTKQEAEEFGKNTTLYKLTMEALASELKQKDPDELFINNMMNNLNTIQSEMGSKALDLVNKQYSKEYKEYSMLKESLDLLKDIKPSPTVMKMISEDITKGITESSVYREGQEAFTNEVDTWWNNMKMDGLDNIRDSEMIKNIRERIENKRKEFDALDIISSSQNNKNESVVIRRQPIVVNQATNTKQSSPVAGLASPGSAWNSDFIDHYFSIDTLKG